MLTATVAGQTWQLHGCDTMHHADKLDRFPAVTETVDFRMRVERDVPFCPPKAAPLTATRVTRTYEEAGGRRVVYRADHKLSLSYDPAFSDVTLRLSPQTAETAVRQYLTVLQSVSYHLLSSGGSLLHSAGLAIGSQGVALAGRAQIGKSTMARHCRQIDPSVAVLCEDAPAVVKAADGFRLCGTPFCGDDELCENRTVPLSGMVLLAQGSRNRLRSLSPQEAMFRLLEVVPRPVFDEEASARAVEVITDWIGSVPIAEFENDGSEEAGSALLQALRAEGWLTERTATL